MKSVRRFLTDSSGALSVLFVILFPLLLLVGGVATDVALLNAQKRYVQSQADLATLSATTYLPDPVATRRAAREVVANNSRYGTITLTDANIRIGRYDPETGVFIAAPNQTTPQFATAVQVVVPSRFRPILLSSVLSDDNITIRRASVGVKRGLIVFTLRNRLLSVNTNRMGPLLDQLLSTVGLDLNTEVLGYRGLATTHVRLHSLLGRIAGTEVGLDALSFNDVMNLQIGRLDLLSNLVNLVGVGNLYINPSQVGSGSLTFGQIVAASPTLLGLTAGDVLPDIELNALDLIGAIAGLKASPGQRLTADLTLDLGNLANVSVSAGLIRAPVIGMGFVGDIPPPRAEVAQVSARLQANALKVGTSDVLRLTLDVGVANATAVPVSLNCGASLPSDQLAVFDVTTSPVSLGLGLSILDVQNTDANVPDGAAQATNLGGGTRRVPIRLDQYQLPVEVTNPITLTGLVRDTGTLLTTMRNDLRSQVSNCRGLLGALLCPIVATVNAVLAATLSLLSSIANVLTSLLAGLGVDALLQSLLNLLGIGVAQADIVLDSYSCGSALAQ